MRSAENTLARQWYVGIIFELRYFFNTLDISFTIISIDIKDVVARRTRLAFLNAQATLESLPYILEIMSEELDWSEKRQSQEFEQAIDFLLTMGLPPPKEKLTLSKVKNGLVLNKQPEHHAFYSRSRFQPEELASFQKIFGGLDVKGEGNIKVVELGPIFKQMGLFKQKAVSTSNSEIDKIVATMTADKEATIEFEEFLEIMSGIKEMQLQASFTSMVEQYEQDLKIPIERASGGV